MQVDLLLSCGHIIIVSVENILEVPKENTVIRCAICEKDRSVSMIGSPYPVIVEEVNDSQ